MSRYNVSEIAKTMNKQLVEILLNAARQNVNKLARLPRNPNTNKHV